MKTTTILAIETSCDETGVAVLQKVGDSIKVLASAVASQVDIHKLTGGVVPEAAAREHVSIIRPLIKKVLTEAGAMDASPDKGRLGGVPPSLTALAVTVGPGLVPALSVGVTAAQTLSFVWQKPIIPVHHIEGHIYSALLAPASKSQFPISNFQFSNNNSFFPALALIVSGGHTMLVKMAGHLQYEILGSTRDDAVGEAFDKVARLLGLPYPGGPALSQLAKQGNPKAFSFSRPMLHSGDLDFSFSGIKTEVLYTLRDLQERRMTKPAADEEIRANIAASFQQAVVETLVKKTKSAAVEHKPALLLLAGGVAANGPLRQQMRAMAKESNISLKLAPHSLCGDNAIMIGLVALFAHQDGREKSWRDIDARARIDLEQISTNWALPRRVL